MNFTNVRIAIVPEHTIVLELGAPLIVDLKRDSAEKEELPSPAYHVQQETAPDLFSNLMLQDGGEYLVPATTA